MTFFLGFLRLIQATKMPEKLAGVLKTCTLPPVPPQIHNTDGNLLVDSEKDVARDGQTSSPPVLQPYQATTAYMRYKHFKMFCMVETANPYPSISWKFEGEIITFDATSTLEKMKVNSLIFK